MAVARGSLRLSRRPLAAVLGLLLAACAAPAPLRLPAELPLRAYDQGYGIRWALERTPEQVRAAGLLDVPSGFNTREVTLALYGLDEGGRIVSRAYGIVRRPFDGGPSPFEVVLRPTGREARFDIRVWADVRPLVGVGR